MVSFLSRYRVSILCKLHIFGKYFRTGRHKSEITMKIIVTIQVTFSLEKTTFFRVSILCKFF